MASEWMEFLAKFRKTSDLKGAEVMKQAGVEYRKKNGGKAKQTKQDRLDESEGKKKGMKKNKQTAGDRLDEAEGKKKGKMSK